MELSERRDTQRRGVLSAFPLGGSHSRYSKCVYVVCVCVCEGGGVGGYLPNAEVSATGFLGSGGASRGAPRVDINYSKLRELCAKFTPHER